jgi:hypothetical protein
MTRSIEMKGTLIGLMLAASAGFSFAQGCGSSVGPGGSMGSAGAGHADASMGSAGSGRDASMGHAGSGGVSGSAGSAGSGGMAGAGGTSGSGGAAGTLGTAGSGGDGGPVCSVARDAGMDAGKIAPATAYVSSSIGPSGMGACPIAVETTELTVGTGTGSSIVGVTDGMGGTSVGCCVVAIGPSSYAVGAAVSTAAGSFTVSGTMTGTGPQTGLTASLVYGGVTYEGSGCTFDFTSLATPPIAFGRVWGTVTCPSMTVVGDPGNVCKGVVLFQLQNCNGSP